MGRNYSVRLQGDGFAVEDRLLLVNLKRYRASIDELTQRVSGTFLLLLQYSTVQQ